MTVKYPAESAFFNPRALIGLGFSAIGLLLRALGFLAFPSSALAAAQCSDVEFTETEEYYGHPYVQMSSDSGCTIYYTVQAWTPPSDPTHSSAIYNPANWPNYEGLGVPLHTHLYYKALAYRADASPVDSPDITEYDVDNTQQ